MLTTLLRPTTGSLELDGLDVTMHPTEVRKRFGVVFQDPSLDSELTAWENMDIHGVLYHVPRHTRRARCEVLLRMFELWDRRDDLVKTFSGGMKRRLEIARGLLHTPKVLFLDEPTLGLDPQSRNQTWTHVRDVRAAEGVTVFLTTHYMDEADRVADRIAVIDHGRLVATGSSAELKTQTGTDSLEAAFLALTGTTIRDESATAADQMRQFGFLKETLVAPVPRLAIMIGRTLGGATVAVLQGLLIFAATLVAGFRPLSVLAVPLAFLLIALIAIVFAALATAIGSSLKEMQGFQMVMNFFVMPLWFLSGALYPLTGLPAALTVLTRIDPLTYGVDGVRGRMLGTSHFGVAVDICVLLAVGAVFVAAGALRFSEIEV